jgi:DNA-binding NarL/FixJ family response regulator
VDREKLTDALPNGAEQVEVLRAIRAVANGEAIFGPGIARRVMGLFSAEKPRARRPSRT